MSENTRKPLNEGYQPISQRQTPSIQHGYQPTTSTEERGYQPLASAGTQQEQSVPPTGGATIQPSSAVTPKK